jgi:hypothetical protein
VKCAKECLDDFRKFNSPSVAISRPISSPAQWIRLPLGIIKLNWDSALDRGKHLMGVRVIARDSERQVVAFMCSVQHHIFDSTIGEAYGAH